MKRTIVTTYILLLLLASSHVACETNWLYDMFTYIASYFAPQAQGNIIIISGASSSGKSSTALALRDLFAEKNIPYLSLPSDEILSGFAKKWIDFLPASHNPDQMLSEGLIFIKGTENGKPKITVKAGSLITDTFFALLESLKIFSRNNVNVIFDAAFDNVDIQKVKEQLKGVPVSFIGITTPLEFAEKREKEREGFEGLTRGQHRQCVVDGKKTFCFIDPKDYDFVVDTSKMSPQEAAKKIYVFLESKKEAV